MEKLQDTINKIIDNHDEWCTLEGKKIGLKKIIEAVKERDAFIIGEKGIGTEDWISNIYKGVQNELIDKQTKRAEESR